MPDKLHNFVSLDSENAYPIFQYVLKVAPQKLKRQ